MRRVLLAAAFASLLPVAAQAARDELKIGTAQFPSSLHPAIDPEVIKYYVTSFAVRPLTAFTPDWQNSCLMCTELPSLANGLAKIEGNGMRVTLRLRPEMKWGDGTPVTAKDLEFTWKLGRDPSSGFSNFAPWNRATGLEMTGTHEAVLHLAEIRTNFANWNELVPAHLEQAAAAGEPGTYVRQTLYNRAPTTPGLWNGPFLVSQYQSGAQIVLEPNPHWGGQKPALKRIIIKFIANTAALQANLLSGDVDTTAVGLTTDQILALRKQYPDRFTYLARPTTGYEHIDLQRGNRLLQDIRIRRAMLHAVDRQTLVDRIFEGTTRPASGFVAELDPNYTDAVPQYGYDPARARALLAESGFTPGPDGICRNAAGERLSLDWVTTAGNRQRELVQQVFQNQWKSACIDVVIKNEPARTYFGETLKKRSYTGLALYNWVSSVGESPGQTLATRSIPTAENNWGGVNWSAFSDPEMEQLIARADRELDPAAQKPLWARMQQIYAEQLWVLPLYHPTAMLVVPKWMKGMALTGHSDNGSLWAETWTPE